MWWFNLQDGNPKAAPELLGRLELKLMGCIWRRGESSVRGLHSEFSPRLAYTTIMTTLDRLYKKGLLARRRVGKAYVYEARLNEKQYRERVAGHLIDMALHDGKHASAVLSCFVDAVSEPDRQMLDQLDELVKAKRRSLRRPEPK